MWTISGLPPGAGSGARSVDIRNATRGLEVYADRFIIVVGSQSHGVRLLISCSVQEPPSRLGGWRSLTRQCPPGAAHRLAQSASAFSNAKRRTYERPRTNTRP